MRSLRSLRSPCLAPRRLRRVCLHRRLVRSRSRTLASFPILAVANESVDVRSANVGEELAGNYDKVFAEPEHKRRMGVVLHPTSLPGMAR